MRYFLLAALATPLLALPVLAQTAPSPTAPTQMPSTQTIPSQIAPSPVVPHTQMPTMGAMPDHRTSATVATEGGLAGANSFTEAQARSRLEKEGFSSVSALEKDKDGIWRGRASKGSQELAIGVDYKGNIISN